MENIKTSSKSIITHNRNKKETKASLYNSEKKHFGFIKSETCKIPENFDRLYEDEIAMMFNGKST